MSGLPIHSYRFGRYLLTVSGDKIHLSSDDYPQTIPTQNLKALGLLVERHGQFVSKEALYDAMTGSVGSDSRAAESPVAKAIHELRLFLNDTSPESRFIQTERGKGGYRFIHPLGSAADAGGKAPDSRAGEDPQATQVLIAELVADASADGMETFKNWLSGRGRFIKWVIVACIAVTVIISIGGAYANWELNKLVVSGAQAIVLVILIGYPMRELKEFVAVDKNDSRQRAIIKVSADCDTLDDWDDASYIATESLRRYKVYWIGILVAWLLLYIFLAVRVHPALDFNCPLESTRYCVGGIDNLEEVVRDLRPDTPSPLHQHLRKHFSRQTLLEVDGYAGAGPRPKALERALMREFNALLKDPYLPRLAAELGKEALDEVEKKEREEGLVAANRLLFEKLYSHKLRKVATEGWHYALSLFTTLCNNISSLMIALCFGVLNKPSVLKKGDRSIGGGAVIFGVVVVVMISVVAVVFAPPNEPETYELHKWLSWGSGIGGGIVMALYIGRLQSKFMGPSLALLVALYSYTAIQSLFIFLEESRTAAIILIDLALALKCLLFLYMAWLFQSGRMLFYLVRVRRAYHDVEREWLIFRHLVKRKSGDTEQASIQEPSAAK